MGRAGLHHLGETCRDMPRMVAIVSAKEDFLSQDHLSAEEVGPQKLRSKGIQHHSSLKKNYLLNTNTQSKVISMLRSSEKQMPR